MSGKLYVATIRIATIASVMGTVALIRNPYSHINQTLTFMREEVKIELETRRNILNNPDYSELGSQHTNGYGPYQPNYRPPNYPYPVPFVPNRMPARRPHYQNGQYGGQQQSIMTALNSISQHDYLQCVPKILCEMTSSTTHSDHAKPTSSYTFLNMDSLLTLLSSFDDKYSSPVVKFGKALVLGYTAKSIRSCRYAYPRCPADPDQLIAYLNNHNGGLFRFFNGIPTSNNPYPYRVQRRIQTRPEKDEYNIYFEPDQETRLYSWRFPSFDAEMYENKNDEHTQINVKQGKTLHFPQENVIDFRPEFHQNLSPVYFPDRTGTGDLRLDSNMFETASDNDILVFKNFK